MKIRKNCKNEIIECETTDNDFIFIKKYYDLAREFKKEKVINLNMSQIGRRYYSSTEKAFQYLINNEAYTIVSKPFKYHNSHNITPAEVKGLRSQLRRSKLHNERSNTKGI